MATRRSKRIATTTTTGLSLRSTKTNSTTQIFGIRNNKETTTTTNSFSRKRTTCVNVGPQPSQKRPAFGDITNKNKENVVPLKKAKDKIANPVKKVVKKTATASSSSIQSLIPVSSSSVQPKCKALLVNPECSIKEEPVVLLQALDLNEKNKSPENQIEKPQIEEKPVEEEIDFDAFDKEHADQPFWEAEYAKDIFKYYKEQEPLFDIPDYMSKTQSDVTAEMRAILMDWLVEVQTNFELNHETLYLASKLVDIYLSKVRIKRSLLQLLGTAALFIACKYDELILPQTTDFLYICDDAYSMDKLFEMERKLFIAVDFQLGIPLSYRFLRRYCKVSNICVKTMTLARYILELTLLEYRFCYERESLKAAGCVWLALKMQNEQWNAMLSHHSGYTNEEAKSMAKKLNQMLLNPHFNNADEVYKKYSHVIFHSVALIPKIQMEQLED